MPKLGRVVGPSRTAFFLFNGFLGVVAAVFTGGIVGVVSTYSQFFNGDIVMVVWPLIAACLLLALTALMGYCGDVHGREGIVFVCIFLLWVLLLVFVCATHFLTILAEATEIRVAFVSKDEEFFEIMKQAFAALLFNNCCVLTGNGGTLIPACKDLDANDNTFCVPSTNNDDVDKYLNGVSGDLCEPLGGAEADEIFRIGNVTDGFCSNGNGELFAEEFINFLSEKLYPVCYSMFALTILTLLTVISGVSGFCCCCGAEGDETGKLLYSTSRAESGGTDFSDMSGVNIPNRNRVFLNPTDNTFAEAGDQENDSEDGVSEVSEDSIDPMSPNHHIIHIDRSLPNPFEREEAEEAEDSYNQSVKNLPPVPPKRNSNPPLPPKNRLPDVDSFDEDEFDYNRSETTRPSVRKRLSRSAGSRSLLSLIGRDDDLLDADLSDLEIVENEEDEDEDTFLGIRRKSEWSQASTGR